MKKNINIFLKYIRKPNIEIRKCTINDVDEIYNIQNIIIENFEQEEKGIFLPFKKRNILKNIEWSNKWWRDIWYFYR